MWFSNEIEQILMTLASPLVDAIRGNSETGYLLACSPEVTAHRLAVFGAALTRDSISDTGNKN